LEYVWYLRKNQKVRATLQKRKGQSRKVKKRLRRKKKGSTRGKKSTRRLKEIEDNQKRDPSRIKKKQQVLGKRLLQNAKRLSKEEKCN